jgi:hypothetical protein
MSEEEPKYHPAVEKIMETSGPDIGRVKDVEVAGDLAVTEELLRSSPYGEESPERTADVVDRRNKYRVAKEAADTHDLDSMVAHVAIDHYPGKIMDGRVAAAHADTKAAVASYDQLVKDAKVPHLEQENVLLQQKLEKARQTIAESAEDKQES